MNQTLPAACILLSTYNGENFLRAQIDSVRGQDHANWQLHVRDDGSNDGTLKLVTEYARMDARIKVVAGANVGVPQSFFDLLAAAPAGRGGYFFCDQDDVWRPDKVSAALAALLAIPGDRPAMYCSRLRYVDAGSRVLGFSPLPTRVGLANALVENIAVGCTLALNDRARSVIVGALPSRAIMHDWWCYLVVSSLGVVTYDPATRIDYRQHGANTVGAQSSAGAVLRTRLQRRWRRPAGVVMRSDQAAELLKCHGPLLPRSNRELVTQFVAGKRSVQDRIRLVSNRSLRRQHWAEQTALICQILLNDY